MQNKSKNETHAKIKVQGTIYLLSDFTTVPLAAAKLRCPRDAFKEGSKIFFFELFEKR